MVMTTLIGMGVGAALSAGIAAAKGGSVGDILKSAGLGGAMGGVTAGVGSAVGGSVAGAVGGALTKAGTAATNAAASSGGGTAAATSGVGAAANTATSATVANATTGSLLGKIGTGLTNTGTKMMQYGAEHGVKASLAGAKAELNSFFNKGVSTGGAASGNAPVPNSGNQGYVGTLPDLNKAGQQLAKGSANQISNNVALPELRPKAVITNGQTSTAANTTQASAQPATTNNATTGSKIKTGLKNAIGQVGVQGALSLLSAAEAARQSKAANGIQEQSLLFQKQMYNESKAKEESTKNKIKQDAWTSYESASLFGSTLYGSDSNNTLLTNGTGNQGNFSILTVGLGSRKTDIT